MSERPGRGPWARLLATAVVRDEGSALGEHGRALLREGAVDDIEVVQGTCSASVAGCAVALSAEPVPPRIWAAASRSVRGNPGLEDAVAGRSQSVQLEHLMNEDWSEPLVPRPYELGRSCSCDARGLCEHVAALAYAFAERIDADPSLLLLWRGCVAEPETAEAAAEAPRPAVDPADPDSWRAGTFPEPRPPRPLPAGAVLKRLGSSSLELHGEDLADVLQRAYAAFAR